MIMSLRSFLKHITPQFIIELYRSQRSKQNASKREGLKQKGEVLTESEVKNALTQIGIKTGDVVMLHSSLSKLGYVDGGASTLISALMKTVESEGTLLMPSFPAIGFNYDHLKKDPLFDVRNTPSKMGIVTEVFRTMPGVVRSLHPTDPVCAWGNDAAYFVKDHFGQLTPYNAQSPFMRLIERRGKILLIGVKLESVTNFHTPEDAILNFKYPVYHEKVLTVRLKDENGKVLNMVTKVHDPEMSKKRRCNDLEKAFLENGIMVKFKLGRADCYAIDAKMMHEWLVESYKKGITMYTPFGEN